jgi:hypothetical protein
MVTGRWVGRYARFRKMSTCFFLEAITEMDPTINSDLSRVEKTALVQRLAASGSQRGRPEGGLSVPEWRDSGNASPEGQGMEKNCAPLHDERLLTDRYWRSLAPLYYGASPASRRLRGARAIPVKVGISLKNPSRVTPSCVGVWWYALGPARGIADR